jgi:hypothetical protein
MKKHSLVVGAFLGGLILGSVAVSTSAQVRLQPNVQRIAAQGDWHAFKNSEGIYRYDAKTGQTQKLTYKPQEKGVAYVWGAVAEDKNETLSPGNYEVIEGNTKDAMAVRIERSSGRAWIMYGVKNGESYWQALNAR